MSLQQFLLVLKARFRVVCWTIFATFVVTLGASLLWPKSYTATTAVVLDPKPDPVSNVAIPMGGMQSMTFLSTQREIIQSERVAGKVVKVLKLDDDPLVIKDWKEETDGRGDRVAWLARLLLKKLDVKPARDSTVVEIAFTARDPRLAATVANAFADAFVETSLELKVAPARQYAAWFIEQTKGMRNDLEKAQTHLSDNQRAKGIVAVDEKLDVENARLAELSSQLTAVQAQIADTMSRQVQAEGDKNILPEVLQNSLVQSLKSDIARSEARLQQLAEQLGKNHPQYTRGEAELQAMRQKLEHEINQIAKGIGTSNRVNLQRAVEIKASLDAQKLKVLQLKQQRAELAVIQRDVEGAQRSYDAVMQRLNQSSLESQANQSNVVVLYRATEPVDPSRPRPLLNSFLALFFGTIVGIGLALRREAIDYRIRMREDITGLLGLPVLAAIGPLAQVPVEKAAERLRAHEHHRGSLAGVKT